VEGTEHYVIGRSGFKPKVLVLELVSPTNYYGFLFFEDKIVTQGYIFAMSDDLNGYFYREESPEFGEKFAFINKYVRQDKINRGAECFSKYKCSY